MDLLSHRRRSHIVKGGSRWFDPPKRRTTRDLPLRRGLWWAATPYAPKQAGRRIHV
jgi:hypothetical protein